MIGSFLSCNFHDENSSVRKWSVTLQLTGVKRTYVRTSFPQLSVNYFYDRYVTSIRGTVGRACTIRNSSVRKFLQTFCESHSPIPKSRERSKLNETKDSLSFRNSRSPKLKRVKRVEESSKGMWALFGDERDREREREREREWKEERECEGIATILRAHSWSSDDGWSRRILPGALSL